MKLLKCCLIFLLVVFFISCQNKKNPTESDDQNSEIPNNPTPADASSGIDLNMNLSWQCTDAVSYDVYFDTKNPPIIKVEDNITTKTVNRSGLSYNTTYYWKVVAKKSNNDSLVSDIWKFTTKPRSSTGYKIYKHHIETQLPAFVNIMFQVTDLNEKGIDYLITDDFEVLEDNQAVSPTESAMHIRKKDQIPYILKTVLLLDNSASVGANLEEIKNAAKALVQNIATQQLIAIYKFSENPVLIQDFTSDVSSLTNAINSISLGYATTDLYGSIIEGVSRWEDIYSTNAVQQGFLVALTDGSDTQGSHTLSQALQARGNKKVYTVGLGNEIDPSVLQQLGNAGFFSITDVNDLVTKFTEIQSDMAQYANSFYWLNYMSPKRGDNNHTLELHVKDNIYSGYDSYITGEFNSYGFYSVYSGLYINALATDPYGIDTLYISEYDTLNINAVTYLGNNPPQYEWSSGNENYILVNPNLNDPSIASVIAIVDSGKTTTITLNDVANDLSKTITVIISKNLFLIEGFEEGTLPFGWSTSGYNGWAVTNESSYEGNYCISCGGSYCKTEYLTKELNVSKNTQINISFYTRETDASGDGDLYINGNHVFDWDSNGSSWSLKTSTFNSGSSSLLSFEWRYYTSGYGKTFIDNIEVTW